MLRSENLQKAFDGTQALAGVSIEFPPKGITAIIGPNGAGKTTLLNVLTGFLRPDTGRCFFRDREITRVPAYRIARFGVSRTFQDLRLIRRLSVLENVMLAVSQQRGTNWFYAIVGIGLAKQNSENRARAMKHLQFVGLDDEAAEPASALSYGQQKLLTLACCLATEAPFLLLDEPVAGVHPELISKILGQLEELRADGKSVVFIEHDISAVRAVSDSVIVMDEGKVIAHGPPSEVLERQEIMEAYLG